MTLVFGIIAGVSVAGALALERVPTKRHLLFRSDRGHRGQVPAGEHFRLGGMVTKGSVQRAPEALEVHFIVTDLKNEIP